MKLNTNQQGTKARGPKPTCQMCREKIGNLPYITADGGANGKIIYGHKNCSCKRNYSFKRSDIVHKETYSGFRWGCEWETAKVSSPETRLQAYAWYGLYCCDDGSVEEEFKSPIVNGLVGVKKMVNGIMKLHDFTSDMPNGDTVGTHANVSMTSWEEEGRNLFDLPNRDVERMFDPLRKHLRENPMDCKLVFGRYFTYYAEDNNGYKSEHYNWLRIKRDCLEFRLHKAQSPEQVCNCLFMLKEMTLEVDLYLHGKQSADDTGKALVRHFRQQATGTADNHRKERNAKKA